MSTKEMVKVGKSPLTGHGGLGKELGRIRAHSWEHKTGGEHWDKDAYEFPATGPTTKRHNRAEARRESKVPVSFPKK